MGWMQGFPPAENRVVSMADGSFFEFPALRYSVCNMRLFMPTRDVKSPQVDQYKFHVRLASHPEASNAVNDPYSLPAYQAVADYLKKK
jgi:hypothetical protein